MRYMLLIHHDDEAYASADWKKVGAEYAAFNEALFKTGIGDPGERLEPSDKARTVRVRDGKTEIIDGPYVDTKEQFAGYCTLDVPDLDQAIAWAARCPSSQHGCVEVRPIWPTRGE